MNEVSEGGNVDATVYKTSMEEMESMMVFCANWELSGEDDRLPFLLY
jgi:hypothetical protein